MWTGSSKSQNITIRRELQSNGLDKLERRKSYPFSCQNRNRRGQEIAQMM